MEFKSHRAIYLQIADAMGEQILKHELKEEERIPSVREFSINTEVNPNTVSRTYVYLEEKGIIYKERGIGYFVSKNAYQKTLELKKETFLKQDLPAVFKAMDLLGIKFGELKKLYEENNHENE